MVRIRRVERRGWGGETGDDVFKPGENAMRVLLGLLLLGIVGCGAVPAPEDSQAKVDKAPAQAAAEQKTDAKKSVEGAETLTLKAYSGLFGHVTSVSFSPDGKRIISGNGDKTLKVWDPQTGQKTLALKEHSNNVICD